MGEWWIWKALFVTIIIKISLGKLAVDAKFKVGNGWQTGYMYGLKMSPYNFFISCKGEVVTILWMKQMIKCWPIIKLTSSVKSR